MSAIEQLAKRIAELERRVRELEGRESPAYDSLSRNNKIGLITGRIPDANQVRFYAPASEAHDFTSTTLPSGWSWAGSPFVTPTLSTVNGTFLRVHPGMGNRSFMFRSSEPNPGLLHGVYTSAQTGGYICYRYDDGTDDNFAEIGFYNNNLDDLRLHTRQRSGGGSITTWTGSVNYIGHCLFATIGSSGTKFSNWSLVMQYYSGLSFLTQLAVSDLSFSPTRFGVVFYTPQSWHSYLLDGVN